MPSRNLSGLVVVITIAVTGLVLADTPPLPNGALPVGMARIDITPDHPVRLAGYASRMDEATEVAERLWGKAIAIGDDKGSGPALLIMLDNASATAELTAELTSRLREKAGIRPERLVVLSTHTHSAPLLPELAPWHYAQPFPPEHWAHMVQYRRKLADLLEKVALDALAARRPCRLAWSQGTVTFGGNRRMLADGKWVGFRGGNVVDSPGPEDHDMPVLRVTDVNGALVGLLVNYTCHGTTTNGSYNAIHGDWAGYAQKALEADHPEIVAMVSIGCAGDIGPYPNPHGSLEQAEIYGRQLANEVNRLLQGQWRPVCTELIARQETIQVPLGRMPTREELTKRAEDGQYHLGARDLAKHFLAILDGGGQLPQSFNYSITTWTFCNDLSMIFLPGEVTVDYALRLKRELNSSRLWITAYANGMPCYICSRRLLDEGGYEVDYVMTSYGQPTRLAPEAEDTIIRTIESLIPPGFGRK